MHRPTWFLLALLLLPAPAQARQDRCPLPLDTCIVRFGQMRQRPWLGVYIEVDSLGQRVVRSVLPGGPAERAGVRPGDVLERVNGLAPTEFFATKAGWKQGDHLATVVRRGGHERTLSLEARAIPEDLLARIVGEHMLEAHFAYMVPEGGHTEAQ